MPRKGKASESKRANDNRQWDKTKFRIIDVAIEDRPDVIDHDTRHPIRTVDDIEELVGDYGKVSFSWSDHYDCYYASATLKASTTDWDGWTFSARHESLARAIGILYWYLATRVRNGNVVSPTDDLSW